MEDEKDMLDDRFGFIQKDDCISESQCVKCGNNRGRVCLVYGTKPTKYASASLRKKCPERKLTK